MPANRQTLLRTRQGRLAIVGAASLGSVLISAPVAVADDAEPTQAVSAVESVSAPAPVAPQVQQPTEPVAPPVKAPEQVEPQPVAPPVEPPAQTPAAPTADTSAEQPADTALQSPPSEQSADSPIEPVEQPTASQPRGNGGDEPTSVPVPAGASSLPSSAEASSTESGAGQVSDDDQAVAAIVADFGHNKFRLGGYEVRVDVAAGSALRAGATTAGSTFSVTETTTGGVARDPFTCTTETRQPTPGHIGSPPPAPSTATFCVLNPGPDVVGSRYTGYPTGTSTITVQQLTAAAGLAADPNKQTFNYAAFLATNCFDLEFFSPACFSPHTFSFFNAALRPVAVPDSARTPKGTKVVVVVQRNDELHGLPATGLVVTDGPSHGTATVVDGQVRYVPHAGFVGTDTFTYTIRTASGESTATVTVTVPAAASEVAMTKDERTNDGDNVAGTGAAQAAPAAASGTVRASSEQPAASGATLPNTGGPDGILLGLASLLLVAGGRLVTVGRRHGRGAGHA